MIQASNDLIMVTAFEYEDEDGDRITVRTDQELRTMIALHSSFNHCSDGMFVSDEQSYHFSSNACLVIYPKLTKPSNRRNVHGLKVAIAPTVSSLLLSDIDSTSQNVSEIFSKNKENLPEQNPTDYPIPHDVPCHSRDSNYSIGSNSLQRNHASKEIEILKDSLSFQLGKLNNDTLTFLETLGNGNSGIVRKALHKESQVITAVKSITLDLTGEEQKRILQELEILKK